MTPGPRRKPTELKILEGTYRKDTEPINKAEPEHVHGVEPPEYLNEHAKKEWNRIVPEMEKVGLLTKVDLGTLGIALMNYGLAIEMMESITSFVDENGIKQKRTIQEYITGRSVQKTPELSTLFRSIQAYRGLITEFGLTPSARMKIEVPKQPDKSNPFENYAKKED